MAELDREYVDKLERAVKDAKSLKRQQALEGLFRQAGKLLPNKLRHPDSVITNLHLYAPRGVRRNIAIPRIHPTNNIRRLRLW